MAAPKAPKTVTINDTQYMIAIHPGSEGMEIAAELAAMFGPSLLGLQEIQSNPAKKLGKQVLGEMLARREAIQTELADATGEQAEALKQELAQIDQTFEPDEDALLKLLSEFLGKLKPKPFVALLKQLLSKTTAIGAGNLGDSAVFDIHFAGNYKPLIPLAQEVVRYNGFLDAAAGYL